MKTSELKSIENSLKIVLPDYYKEFQLNYPPELRENLFNKEYFSEDPNFLIDINQNLWKGALSENYFSIGCDIGGNFFFIKLDGEDQIVYYWDHEEVSEKEIYENDLIDDNINWSDFLSPDHQNLQDFKEWLIETWGDSLIQLNLYH